MDVEQVSLFAQIVLLGVLVYGYLQLRRGDVRGHGWTFALATVVHVFSVVVVMVPLFIVSPSHYVSDLGFVSGWNLLHLVGGSAALVLAVYVVARWIRGGFNARGCAGKTLMRVIMILWVVSLVTGIVTHLFF